MKFGCVIAAAMAMAGSIGLSAAPAHAASATSAPATVAQCPTIRFDRADAQSRFGVVYDAALRGLLDTNTVEDTQHVHDPIGRMTSPFRFVRAGSAYNTPWTRDAAINSWSAASLLEPAVARNTLWAVCQRQSDGQIVVQQDNQWWDQVIWIVAVWDHYCVTGDRTFLEQAFPVAQQTLALRTAKQFRPNDGLFAGPAFFADGIAAYPPPEFDAKNPSSFVLDHPYTSQLMALSTNCVYVEALRCAGRMAEALGQADSSREFTTRADALRDRINARLWSAQRQAYDYFIHGDGPDAGKSFAAQEGMGLSFALLFDVADAQQASEIVRGAHVERTGIVTLWPHLPQFDDAHPGRHNVMVWPIVSGFWGCATAKAGAAEPFAAQMEAFAELVRGSDLNFYEIYDARTGKPDGGWQCNRRWPPLSDQTWSASAYIAAIHRGLFGMRFDPDGLRFEPVLPASWGPVTLSGLRYRDMTLDLRLTGHDTRLKRMTIDGQPVPTPVVPASLTGAHRIEIELE
ncbi:MAG: hypothetical protein QM770_05155 [Tepidisphaeraceae bacterium]